MQAERGHCAGDLLDRAGRRESDAHRPLSPRQKSAQPLALVVALDKTEQFEIGKAKILRQSSDDAVTVVAAGITLTEALKAHDELKRQGISIRVIDLFSVRPVDKDALLTAAAATNNTIITVEDHYAAGGMGDAVAEAVGPEGVRVYRLAVREVPHSGKADELLAKYKINSQAIVEEVHAIAPAAVR